MSKEAIMCRALLTITLLGLAALAVACQGEGGPEPSPTAPAPTPTAEPTPTATPEPQTAVTTERGVYIYIVRPDGSDLRGPITATGFGWSPDSTRLAVVTSHCDRIFSVVNPESGSSEEIASFPDLAGFINEFQWAPDSQRLLIGILEPSGATPLFLVNASGEGEPIKLVEGELFVWSPDGTKIAYADLREAPDRIAPGKLKVLNVVDGQTMTIAEELSRGAIAWAPDGKRLAYSAAADGFVTNLVVIGADGSDPTVVTGGGSEPVWAADGQQIISSTNNVIAVVAAAGGPVQEVGQGFSFDSSPDGQTIAVYNNLQNGQTEIKVYDLSSGTSRLVSEGLMPAGGVVALSPEADRVIFEAESDTPGLRELYLASVDGSELRKLVQPVGGIGRADWSPDGRDIAFWDVPPIGLEC